MFGFKKNSKSAESTLLAEVRVTNSVERDKVSVDVLVNPNLHLKLWSKPRPDDFKGNADNSYVFQILASKL